MEEIQIDPKVKEILENDNMPEIDKIQELHKLGFTRNQLINELGFKRATVYLALPVKGEKQEEGEKDDKSKFPLILKTKGGQEVISPEAILEGYLLSDGDAGTWMLKGFMLYRAAQLAVMSDVEIMKGQADAQAAAIKPILDLMEKAREDMDAAAERAKESGAEIAAEAAAGAAAKAVMHIDQKIEELKKQKVDIATVQDPMKGLMARTMESMMTRMEAMFLGGPVGPTPGLVDKRPK